VFTFETELEQSLIVYGTQDEATANAQAAYTLQQAVRLREHNIIVRIKKDVDVTVEELKSHHLLLVGRPGSNSIVARFSNSLPIIFGSHSFEVGDDVYAHPESGIVLAAENPLNPRYSIVVIAGLSGAGTMRLVPKFEDDELSYVQVIVLPYQQQEVDLLVPPKEFVRELLPE
jgi:hypothetical protein